jgi:hypothetical protein
MVGQSGLEPPTSRLSVVCSNQLSYWPSSKQSPLGSVSVTSLPTAAENSVRFLASPLQIEPASLGFNLLETMVTIFGFLWGAGGD